MTYSEIQKLRTLGFSDPQIQKLGKCYFGESVACGVGTTTTNPQIPGSGKVLLGIAVLPGDTAVGQVQMTLRLNNEVVFDDTPVSIIGANRQALSIDNYQECTRKLHGSDVMQIQFNCVASTTVDYVLIYLS